MRILNKLPKDLSSHLAKRPTLENDPQCFSNRRKIVIMGVLVMLSGCPGLYTTICFPGFNIASYNDQKKFIY